MSLTLRYMQASDVQEVAYIDRVSFDPPWPPRSYLYEINESTYSYMVTLEQRQPRIVKHWQRWLRALRGLNGRVPDQAVVVGYGGLWKIADEAHISTIAIHPDYRGRGYGEILLSGMCNRSAALGAGYIVLEVRAGNTIAQNLYRKYGFTVFGVKPEYYRSNNEDAFDMRLYLTEEGALETLRRHYETLHERVIFQDAFSYSPHPRMG